MDKDFSNPKKLYKILRPYLHPQKKRRTTQEGIPHEGHPNPVKDVVISTPPEKYLLPRYTQITRFSEFDQSIYSSSIPTIIRSDGLTLVSLWIELRCSEHGLERFRIKIVKKFNMSPNTITPEFRSRRKASGLSRLLVGRDVSNHEIENYLIDYFREGGLWESILKMKLEV